MDVGSVKVDPMGERSTGFFELLLFHEPRDDDAGIGRQRHRSRSSRRRMALSVWGAPVVVDASSRVRSRNAAIRSRRSARSVNMCRISPSSERSFSRACALRRSITRSSRFRMVSVPICRRSPQVLDAVNSIAGSLSTTEAVTKMRGVGT